ncbi:hypothetical protein GDO86_000876 [Hymenochirus boettgeri]|uniref:Bone morphogenetic protein 3 n=1 Tax=Hymenochirus boettgeri TaxID=247094 RepID=A0A8T2KGA1_9PIPI|nr:hypothetical protein GDO86_000876 [Hymenochirus boettgeri]
MAQCLPWLLVWVGCSSCLCLVFGEQLKDDPARQGEAALPLGDTVSEHMLRLYDKYRGGGGRGRESSRHLLHLREGNTVRSFRDMNGDKHDKNHHMFNLTSLTTSENILSATLHYYLGDLLNTSHRCPHSLTCQRHRHGETDYTLDLTMWSFAGHEYPIRVLGNFLVNISTSYRDLPTWQWKDITQALSQAKKYGEVLIGINMTIDFPSQRRRENLDLKPYILVYANDSAISEPDSVVSNLHMQHNSQTFKPNRKVGKAVQRRRRSTDILLPLQNNELPGAEYQYSVDEEGWEEKKPYKSLQDRPAEKGKNKKKLRKGNRQKSQTLQFDEQTLRKARKKQWNEPRNCARRYLKVDFADIGWSEWIISPKSFDAYYCSGACQFPMPKSLKPSNHATIQSIVRAVGVVPGIPEPCCVPEKMSSLSILFLDENKNVVLKVYPNMTVESCACR